MAYGVSVYVGSKEKDAATAVDDLKTKLQTVDTGSFIRYASVLPIGPGKYYEPILIWTDGT